MLQIKSTDMRFYGDLVECANENNDLVRIYQQFITSDRKIFVFEVFFF